MLWLTVPTFPLPLLIFSIRLARIRIVPRWISVALCIAATAYPVARILRMHWIAYAADVMMIGPFFTSLGPLDDGRRRCTTKQPESRAGAIGKYLHKLAYRGYPTLNQGQC